jgi:uncharacterized membrane protein YfcA
VFDVGLTATELAIGTGVVVVAAALQGSIGFGLAVLSVPILTVVNPVFTPIPTLILSLLVGVGTLLRERGDLDLDGLGWVITGRVPGAVLGAWVLSIATERTLGIVIGVIVLLAVGVLGSGISVKLSRTSRVIAGTISGFSGTSAGIGGPPIALLYGRQSGPVVRSTLGAIFTIGITVNLVILTALGVLTETDIGVAVLLTPAVAVGFLISGRLRPHVDGERVRTGILIVSSIAALSLLVRSLIG